MVSLWNRKKKEEKGLNEEKVLNEGKEKKSITDLIPISSTRAPSIKANVVRQIVIELMDIMKNHIGNKKAITREELFRKIFLKECDVRKLDDWLRWEFVKKAMHYCRLHTKCFIGSQIENSKWIYFIVEKDSDVKFYCDNLNKRIKSMNLMKLKAAKAVDEQWHKTKWELPERDMKLLK